MCCMRFVQLWRRHQIISIKMKNFIISATSILVMTALLSCHRNNNEGNHEVARQLFMKSMYLTEKYIDSLEQAKDSAALNRIVENFNLKITSVNYEFPPDTDLDLSEEENDSLIRMFKRIDSTVGKKLKSFAEKTANDSIPADSIPIDSTKAVKASSGI